jgi:REP element-mobilizing transposase RayT
MSTYSQIYIHIIFAVQGRQSLILPEWEERLYKYITGIVQKKDQKMLAINGMPDHIHFLMGMRPSCCISDIVREVKKASNEFIRQNNFVKSNFNWQEGFAAFSYSHSQLNDVLNYISNQKNHHLKTTFKDEYVDLLKRFSVDYNNKYLFEWIN